MDPQANMPQSQGTYTATSGNPQVSAEATEQAKKQLKSAYQLTYFFGVIGIAYGALILNLSSISQEAGTLGMLLIGQGVVFLVLGYLVSQRSKVAAYISLGLAALELIENVALGNLDWAVFVAPVLYGFFIWRGLVAIDKLKG